MPLIARLVPLIAMLLGCQVQDVSSAETASKPDAGTSTIDAVLDHLNPVLKSSGTVARIYYAKCRTDDSRYVVSYPPARGKAPASDETGLAAVRDIFRDDADVSVVEDQGGIIRIVIGQVPMSILATKIPFIAFDPPEQYTENLAIWRLTDADEVSAAERELGVQVESPVVRISLGMDPAPGLPHLPEWLTDVTFDQALDAVATTFGGVVVYGICAEKQRYIVYFASIPKDFP